MRIYTNQEDGLYGGAVDNNFDRPLGLPLLRAADSPERQALDRPVVTQTTPNTNAPNSAASLTAWDPYVGYFQLSRFKFIDDAPGVPAHLDLTFEQQILRVSNNRQECCHVAGDMDFDKDNNLWMTTGDDTPAAGIDANGYGPFEDQLLDEQQTVRATNATGGTFTLTFNGQTTAPIPYNATRARSTRRWRRSPTSAPTTSRPAAARSTRRTSTCSSVVRCSSPTRTRSPPTAPR